MHSGTDHVSLAEPVTATIAVAVPGALLADALARLMREHGLHVVAACATFGALEDRLRFCRPTVVLVDSELWPGDVAPADVLAGLQALAPDSRLVVLAPAGDAELARAAIEGGAHAVIPKSSSTLDALATLVHAADGFLGRAGSRFTRRLPPKPLAGGAPRR